MQLNFYKIILAYDGADFQGMQRQADVRTVQGEVESALRRIGWKGTSILAAGRTDSGVHASGQVVRFEHHWNHSLDDLRNALNANLPPDVAVQAIETVSADFHPRYGAVSRTYRYRIFCQPNRDPLRERYAWRVWPQPDFEKLQAAAHMLIGERDFAAFGTPPKEDGHTIRQVHAAEWKSADDELVFEVTANAYLYHMVRRMAQIQVDIGLGKRDLDELKAYLDQPQQGMIPGLAPPHGLSLTHVAYPPNQE